MVTNRCYLCGEEEEVCDQILLNLGKTRDVIIFFLIINFW